jgi:hypothetical protein
MVMPILLKEVMAIQGLASEQHCHDMAAELGGEVV